MSQLPTDEGTGKPWRRRKYTVDEQRAIIKLYDGFKCKAEAMRAINSIEGYEHVYVRKVRRWKSQSKPMGRPVSPEFEVEVMEEYMMAMQQTLTCPLRQKSSHSYSMMKECAKKVFNNDYWDEGTSSYVKRWQLDKRTCNLQFTNKWVSGMLRRDKDKGVSSLPTDEVATDDHAVEEQAMGEELVESSCGDDQCGAGFPSSADIDVLFHEVADGIDHLAASFDTDYYSLFNAAEEFSLIDWDNLFE